MHKYSVALLVRPLAGAALFLGDALPELELLATIPPRLLLRPIARPILTCVPLHRRAFADQGVPTENGVAGQTQSILARGGGDYSCPIRTLFALFWVSI